MPHVEKLADLPVPLPIFHVTSLGTIEGGLTLRAVYWSWRSGEAIALHIMQHFGIITV
jgi:hypothetical protein